MTFTYTGNPSQSDRDKIRFLIGDTISADAHFQDEEITWMLSEWSNDVYKAATAACEILAGRYAHKAQVSKSVGDLSISESYGAQSSSFLALADRLKAQHLSKNVPSPRVSANALKSTANRTVTNPTTDFTVGGMDNLKGSNPNYLDGKAY